MSDLDYLIQHLDKITYPQTMIPVKDKILGIAFFPGGKGIFKENDDNLSGKEIMILGQDFDCDFNYKKSLKAGKEDINKNPTWRNILSFLNELGISPENCFFTNLIMGVRVGNKGTGKSPGAKDPDFLRACQDFFQLQLDVQKPKIILVLGIYTAKFLSATSDDLNCWRNIQTFKDVDSSNHQIIRNATFKNGIQCNLALLTHPSFRSSNIHRRKFDQFSGHEAEIEMVRGML